MISQLNVSNSPGAFRYQPSLVGLLVLSLVTLSRCELPEGDIVAEEGCTTWSKVYVSDPATRVAPSSARMVGKHGTNLSLLTKDTAASRITSRS
ncbi:hypothetical protein PGQ11_004949 [Apiospora arundinis]|uniref:Uncharacterized protein n=1 Tax=Apiospora arundinis TaxID=335852 RepID=A0ABR2JAZ9_9PEZI